MTDRRTPHDPIAEASLLGACFLTRAAVIDATTRLTGAAFYEPKHRMIYDAIAALHADGQPVDVVTVASKLGSDLDRIGGRRYLLHLTTETPASTNHPVYVDQLTALAWRRRLIAAAADLTAAAYDLDVPASTTVAAAADLGTRIGQPTLTLPQPLPSLESVMAEHAGDTIHDWIMPGVLERGERVMVVAPEGQGKSWLLRQWAWQLAAGVHWNQPKMTPPSKVLIVDAENSVRQITRGSGRMLYMARRAAGTDWNPDNLKLVCEPSLDLMQPRYRDTIEGHLEVEQPDVLVIGPLYKAFSSNSRWSYEDNAMAAASIIDDWRARFGVAVLLEHHAAKSSGGTRILDPVGSSVWMRWPEFGITLSYAPNAAAYRVGRFRGDREQRDWPHWYTRSAEPHAWPWRPHMSDEPPSHEPAPARERYVDDDTF